MNEDCSGIVCVVSVGVCDIRLLIYSVLYAYGAIYMYLEFQAISVTVIKILEQHGQSESEESLM